MVWSSLAKILSTFSLGVPDYSKSHNPVQSAETKKCTMHDPDSNVQQHLPPTPCSPSAQFCTEHKLPLLHTAARQHSVCNVTRSKYSRRWCPRPRLQLAGSTLPYALEPASTCTTCTNLSLQGTLAWTSFKLWRTLEHYLGVFKSKSTSKSKSQGSYIHLNVQLQALKSVSWTKSIQSLMS